MNSVRSQYHVRMGILKDLQPYGNNFALWAAGRPGQCILHYVWVLRSNCVRAGTFFLHHVPTYIRLSVKWKASKYLIGVLGSNPHYLSVMLQVSIGGRNWPSDFNHFPKLNFLKVTSKQRGNLHRGWSPCETHRKRRASHWIYPWESGRSINVRPRPQTHRCG